MRAFNVPFLWNRRFDVPCRVCVCASQFECMSWWEKSCASITQQCRCWCSHLHLVTHCVEYRIGFGFQVEFSSRHLTCQAARIFSTLFFYLRDVWACERLTFSVPGLSVSVQLTKPSRNKNWDNNKQTNKQIKKHWIQMIFYIKLGYLFLISNSLITKRLKIVVKRTNWRGISVLRSNLSKKMTLTDIL